jgi:hypothetical protein
MKTLKLFIVLIPFLGFFSCEKGELKQTDIEKYVKALRTNQYDDRDLPVFTYKHIGELLEYRNEKDAITKFPRNPASSLYQEECELRVYILWTIESIRAVAIDSEFLTGRFPSQNPILKLRTSEELELVYDVEAYQIISDAYYVWWTNNRDKSVDEMMGIDPLEHTEYEWH